jgi:glycerol kinase
VGRPVPLHALLVDQQAALFGQACFEPGAAKCTFGTGAFLLMNLGATPRLSDHGLITTVAWQFPGQLAYALDGGIFVMGAAVQWLADDLRLLPDVAASGDLAAHSTDDTVVCVPALAGLAAPYWQGQARGAYFGLSRATTPADLARATLDGLACRVADVVTAMQADLAQTGAAFPPYLKVDGGPTANAYLMQAVADLTNLEVRVAAAREATAIGVANLAAHAALGTSLDELAARWQAEAIYNPRLTADARAAKLHRWHAAVESVLHFHGASSP